mmetsp:Transcript_42880/g.100663  ORF Transcript_42880/g.100663 Transcript_42880/m.100663 type:complete len:320 (+) Transcript_42880:1684-2643(+)
MEEILERRRIKIEEAEARAAHYDAEDVALAEAYRTDERVLQDRQVRRRADRRAGHRKFVDTLLDYLECDPSVGVAAAPPPPPPSDASIGDVGELDIHGKVDPGHTFFHPPSWKELRTFGGCRGRLPVAAAKEGERRLDLFESGSEEFVDAGMVMSPLADPRDKFMASESGGEGPSQAQKRAVATSVPLSTKSTPTMEAVSKEEFPHQTGINLVPPSPILYSPSPRHAPLQSPAEKSPAQVKSRKSIVREADSFLRNIARQDASFCFGEEDDDGCQANFFSIVDTSPDRFQDVAPTGRLSALYHSAKSDLSNESGDSIDP